MNHFKNTFLIAKSIDRPKYKILKDDEKNAFLIQNGYVVLPILNDEALTSFKRLYKKWHPVPPDAFYKSYFSENQTYKSEVENEIIEKCLPQIDNHFVDYNAFGAMFVVKPHGDAGHISPHQDWSFVDETKHWSLNMWLPIQDTNERNGTMRFLKGSHFFLDSIRGANTPELYAHLLDSIEPNLVDVPLNAGEAVFFYHGIVHCSHYNKMDNERVCVGLSVIEKNAPLFFHLLKPNEEIPEKYEVSPSFFINYAHNRGEVPLSAKYLGKDQRGFPTLTPDDLTKRMNQF